MEWRIGAPRLPQKKNRKGNESPEWHGQRSLRAKQKALIQARREFLNVR